ncbi:hypothetical protein PDE_04101 [Penicillium oxalicum 114-2]|uniref:Blastomyces yeast-phase-specific protein n=1 Tax=Penicillium oxalicum (strain 114-2 / CGMCC 5302) TaxID=933388 RepID=S8B3P5_PENO1|nr:hypothetical protein PDE_04101 [Penicillium oxalicum 114-2]
MHFSKPTTTTLLLSPPPSHPTHHRHHRQRHRPQQMLFPPLSLYTEPLHYDPASGGVALKITTSAGGLFNGSPQTNFAYTLDGQGVWYDLSDVFGDAFAGEALAVVASKEDCPGICWPEGVDPNGASETKVCEASSDVTLTVCAGSC